MEEQQLAIEQLDTEYSQLQQNLQMIQSAKQNATNPLAHIKEELKQNENRLNKLTQVVETAQKKIDRLRQVVNVQTVMEDDLNDWRERVSNIIVSVDCKTTDIGFVSSTSCDLTDISGYLSLRIAQHSKAEAKR